MRLSVLPPVRRAVPLRRGSAATRLSMERFFGNRRIDLYTSGTAALAQAIAHCAARSTVSPREVIIPAYGCPDLVAACSHAAVYPRLVDIAPSLWSYDLEALQSNLSPNTVAIVAVNLLGLGDGSAALIRLCKDRHIPLIQDSAQYLPREPIDWPGEYVVLSFGRGKPMNLLHGGALIEPPGNGDSSSAHSSRYTLRDRVLASRAAAVAFNALTHPFAYSAISALPGTGLGQVVYKPPGNADLLPLRAWSRVGAAFELYRNCRSYSREIWDLAIAEWAAFGIQPLHSLGSPPQPEPLRLALLAPDRAARDALVIDLNRSGLGASRLYGTDLTKVAKVPEAVRCQGPFPHATIFSDKLLTLPTHGLVTTKAVHTACEVVRAWHRSRTIQRPVYARTP